MQPDHLYLLVENAPSVEAAIEMTRKTIAEGTPIEGSIVTPIDFDELAAADVCCGVPATHRGDDDTYWCDSCWAMRESFGGDAPEQSEDEPAVACMHSYPIAACVKCGQEP